MTVDTTKPICFEHSQPFRFRNFLLEYFSYHKGRYYQVFHSEKNTHYVVKKVKTFSWVETALKVVSYATVIIPILVLALQPVYCKPLAGNFELWDRERHFQIEDIQLLAHKSIGLRHVSYQTAALLEKIQGIVDGCSFNLTFQRSEHGDIGFANLPEEVSSTTLSENEKLRKIFTYEKAVSGNIQSSITYDIPNSIQLGHTLLSPIIKRIEDTSFLVIDYNKTWGAKPTDFNGYQGLGRFPKQYVRPEAIATILPFFEASKVPSPLITEIIVSKEQVDTIFNKIEEYFRVELLKYVRTNHAQFVNRPNI